MTASTDAQVLLHAWELQTAQGEAIHSVPFPEAVMHLLKHQRLDEALNAVGEIDPMPLTNEALANFMNLAHAISMEQVIGDPEDPTAPFGLLVALPMFGLLPKLVLDEHFWPAVNAHLLTSAQAHLGKADVKFFLQPMTRLVRPEALAMLTVDSLHALTHELGQGQPGAAAATLVGLEEEVDASSDTFMHSAHVSVMGQRLALATVVYDPSDWEKHASVAEWLSDLMADDAWTRHFFEADRAVMLPMAVPEAMIEALGTRMRMMVDIDLDDRGMNPDREMATLDWEVLDSDGSDGLVTFLPVVNGVTLDPVPFPGGWAALIGPDGLNEACNIWLEAPSLAHQHEATREPEPLTPTPSRRRLH
jgi:hypothetical protein